MSTFSKHLSAVLLSAALITSCSRPVAYFQPTAREQFKATPPATVVAVTSTQAIDAMPIEATTPITPAEQLNQTKQVVNQVEAYVRNDSKLASNKKLTRRIAHLNELLVTADAKAPTTANSASTKKSTMMERMMLKKLDKKIKNHVAPDATKEMSSNLRLGLIIGAVGLLLWILGTGVLSVIGVIGFIVGIVLIVLDLVGR